MNNYIRPRYLFTLSYTYTILLPLLFREKIISFNSINFLVIVQQIFQPFYPLITLDLPHNGPYAFHTEHSIKSYIYLLGVNKILNFGILLNHVKKIQLYSTSGKNMTKQHYMKQLQCWSTTYLWDNMFFFATNNV